MKLFDVYAQYDVEPISGQGSYVFTKNGQRYLDFYGGHAVISIGHSHPHYMERIGQQLERLAFYSNAVPNALQEELAGRLGKASGLTDYQLFLCNSGAEANENALKMASFHNGRTKIIAFKNGFHGRTSAAVNITDNTSIQAPINQTFSVEYHQLNELDSVAESIQKGDVCAVIIEGIQGIGGIHIPKAAFLEHLAALCQQNDSLLILDEVQSGYGRSGHFFAFQNAKIKPDLITVAKGMGNGFPIGGLLLNPRFEAKSGMLGSTFGGSHLACAAGIAVLEVIEEEQLLANAKTQGELLLAALSELPGLVEIRGQGLMIGLEFEFSTKAMRLALLHEQHIFTGSASDPNVLRLLPPLTITNDESELFISAIKQAVHSLA